MYSDGSEHRHSEFYYQEENIQSTSTSVFEPNTEENTSVSGYDVNNIVDSD